MFATMHGRAVSSSIGGMPNVVCPTEIPDEVVDADQR